MTKSPHKIQKEISSRLLNGFLESELDSIYQGYEKKGMTDHHQKAGRAIAWVCYAFRDQLLEAFSDN